MKHKFPCVESMRRVHLSSGRVVRVWRDRTAEPLSAHYDDGDIMSTCVVHANDDTQLLAALAKLTGVNAVEIVDAGGQGTVVYTAWP